MIIGTSSLTGNSIVSHNNETVAEFTALSDAEDFVTLAAEGYETMSSVQVQAHKNATNAAA